MLNHISVRQTETAENRTHLNKLYDQLHTVTQQQKSILNALSKTTKNQEDQFERDTGNGNDFLLELFTTQSQL